MEPLSFHSIPADLLPGITNRLPLKQLLMLSATCKFAQHTVLPSLRSFHEEIQFAADKTSNCAALVSFRGLSRCTRLAELEFGPVSCLDGSASIQLFNNIKMLTNLQSLKCHMPEQPAAISSFLDAISSSNLSKLEIARSEKSTEQLFAAAQEVFKRISQQSQLRDLRLLNFHTWSENKSEQQIISYLTSLSNLEVLYLPPSISNWEIFSRLQKLQLLVVSDYSSSQCIRYGSLYTNLQAMELDVLHQTIRKLEVVKANVIVRFLHPATGAESFWTFMGAAAKPEKPAILQHMISLSDKVASFQVNIPDLGGYTPLMNVRSLETFQFLIEQGANVNAVTNGRFPRSDLVRISTLLSEIILRNANGIGNNLVNDMMITKYILQKTDADLMIGSPPIFQLAISMNTPVLRWILKMRPTLLHDKPLEFIIWCRDQCKDESTWALLKKSIPEAVAMEVEKMLEAAHST